MKMLIALTFALSCFMSAAADVPHTKNGHHQQNVPSFIAYRNMDFDFGTVPEGEVIEYVFYFKNSGNEALIINDASPACGCTKAYWSKEPVQPGMSGSIKVVFNTKGKSGRQNQKIYVYSNGEKEAQILSITGIVAAKAATTGSTQSRTSSALHVTPIAHNDLKEEELKGSVRRVTATMFEADEKTGVISKKPYLKIIKNFNKDGFLTSAEEYNNKGKKVSKTESVFLTDGRKKENKEVNYDEDGEADFYVLTNYNSIGQQVVIITYYPDENLKAKVEMKYDKRGNVIEKWHGMTEAERAKDFEKMEYDDKDNIVKLTKKDGDGTTVYVYKYGYDARGNKLSEQVWKNNNEEEKYTYKWDSVGNLTESNEFVKGKVYTTKYEYDSAGNTVKKTLFSDNKTLGYVMCVYEYYN